MQIITFNHKNKSQKQSPILSDLMFDEPLNLKFVLNRLAIDQNNII